MKTICLAALKGGVGKTMQAVSLAYVAANQFHKKVLLIDMDPQSSASIILGVTPNNYDSRTPFDDIPALLEKLEGEDMSYEIDYLDDPEVQTMDDENSVMGIHTIFDRMLEYGMESLDIDFIKQCIHRPKFNLTNFKKEKGKIVKDENGNPLTETIPQYFGFDIIPSTEYLSDIQLLWGTEGSKDDPNYYNRRMVHARRGVQLDTVIQLIDRYMDYDYCIIDCPPSLELLAVNSMYAASTGGIIIPASQDKQSLYSLARIKENIRTIKANKPGHVGALGIVLTIFKPSRTVDKYIKKTVGKDLRMKVFKTEISETADAKKAILSGMILPQINDRNFNENCALFKEIEKTSDELNAREQKRLQEMEEEGE